jgi:RimJ/RimL family protein N-acetyltransferase
VQHLVDRSSIPVIVCCSAAVRFASRRGGTWLHAHTLPDNRRALRVLDKLGFPRTAAHKRNMMHVTLHLDRPGKSLYVRDDYHPGF